MYKIVMLRHGESQWNKENRFTGWADVPLSDKGVEEARRAGAQLKKDGYSFDIAFTSMLKRANKTLNLALEEMDQLYIPVIHTWTLNERHYGALQGLNKAETAQKYGDDQVKIWRRSYDVRPPLLEPGDERCADGDPRYKDVPKDKLPLGECLKDTVARVVPFWESDIVPVIKSGKRVVIAAHGNSLRALVQHLDSLSPAEIMELNIPTGVPLVYELDENMKPIRHMYLGDPDEIAKAAAAVANQGKAK